MNADHPVEDLERLPLPVLRFALSSHKFSRELIKALAGVSALALAGLFVFYLFNPNAPFFHPIQWEEVRKYAPAAVVVALCGATARTWFLRYQGKAWFNALYLGPTFLTIGLIQQGSPMVGLGAIMVLVGAFMLSAKRIKQLIEDRRAGPAA